MINRFSSALLVIALTLTFSGCSNGGGSGGDPSPDVSSSTADFFHLAVVPYQTVTTASFEVQVIAENTNLNSPPPAPVVTDANGANHTMVLKTLQWPDGSGPSVQVYSAVVPLKLGQLNDIRVTSGIKVLLFPITQKSALNIRTATDSISLQNDIKAAIADPTIDVIQIGYDEADLGLIVNNVGSGIANRRTTWLTLVPAVGKVVTWNRDYLAGMAFRTNRRPAVNFLNLSGITFGSPTSNGGAYQLLTEGGFHLWLSGVQFLGKYDSSVPNTTPMSPTDYIPDVSISNTGGQKIYFTDCLWRGTSNVATYGAELARDLRFDSHRGDFNNFGKVFLNASAQDIAEIRISDNSDVYHNDGFQLFASTAPTSNLVFKGFKVTKQNVSSTSLQPMFATVGPFSNVLVDSVFVRGASATTVLQSQISGTWSNSRISNIFQDEQRFTIRQDGSFIPTNVYMQNIDVKSYQYCSPTTPGCTGAPLISIANGYPPDVTSYFQAIPGLSGITFSNIRLH